jgi:hypothetical protein
LKPEKALGYSSVSSIFEKAMLIPKISKEIQTEEVLKPPYCKELITYDPVGRSATVDGKDDN